MIGVPNIFLICIKIRRTFHCKAHCKQDQSYLPTYKININSRNLENSMTLMIQVVVVVVTMTITTLMQVYHCHKPVL